ncbi:MAG: GDSL family lipase, partial [Lentisphaerae bacterium]|nr:GDSL family lipase [Lentisphaerota bacterium]
MLIDKGSKLVMIGDSVTDCGRARPVGEGREALGNGYVNNVQS